MSYRVIFVYMIGRNVVNPEKSLYITSKILEYIPKAKRVGNKLNFRCPLCGDGKKSNSTRGWFYIDTCSYYCWNEGCIANEHGISGVRLLSLISGQDLDTVKYDIFKNAYNNNLSLSLHESSNSNADPETQLFDAIDVEKHVHKVESEIEKKLNDGAWSEDLPENAKRYLDQRHIFDAPFLPKEFKFYYDKEKDRIVIPWSNDFWQERTFLPCQNKEPKYLFPSTEKPIFGLDWIDRSYKKIFVMEGVFDCIWVKNAVATGGIKMSESQVELMKSYEDEGFEIVFFPDNQLADEAGKHKSVELIEQNPEKKMFIWPKQLKKYKDINESIKASMKFIDLWKSTDFIEANMFSGIQARFKLG